MHAVATHGPSGSLSLSRHRIFLSSAHSFELDSPLRSSARNVLERTRRKNRRLLRRNDPSNGGRGAALIVAFLSLAALSFVVLAAMFPVWVEVGRFETADAHTEHVRAKMAASGFAESVDYRIREGAIIEANSRRTDEALVALGCLTGCCPDLIITGKTSGPKSLLSNHDPGGSPTRVLTMAAANR